MLAAPVAAAFLPALMAGGGAAAGASGATATGAGAGTAAGATSAAGAAISKVANFKNIAAAAGSALTSHADAQAQSYWDSQSIRPMPRFAESRK